jgi:hypothetical protein
MNVVFLKSTINSRSQYLHPQPPAINAPLNEIHLNKVIENVPHSQILPSLTFHILDSIYATTRAILLADDTNPSAIRVETRIHLNLGD